MDLSIQIRKKKGDDMKHCISLFCTWAYDQEWLMENIPLSIAVKIEENAYITIAIEDYDYCN